MKDIVKDYGLRGIAVIYWLDDAALMLHRIDSKRVLFEMVGDETDRTELWISISPTEVRLYPRNREDYEKDTIFSEPLSEYDPGKSHYSRKMSCAYYRHKDFYRDLMGYWGNKVTVQGGEPHHPDIQYIFYMKDCWRDWISDSILAIYHDVMKRADEGEQPYKELDNRSKNCII